MVDPVVASPQEQNLRNKVRTWIAQSEAKSDPGTLNQNPLHKARDEFKKALADSLTVETDPNKKKTRFAEEMGRFDKHIEDKMVAGYAKGSHEIPKGEDKDAHEAGKDGINQVLTGLLEGVGGFFGTILSFVRKIPLIGNLISRGADWIMCGFDSQKVAELDKKRSAAGAVHSLDVFCGQENVEFNLGEKVSKVAMQNALVKQDLDKPGSVAAAPAMRPSELPPVPPAPAIPPGTVSPTVGPSTGTAPSGVPPVGGPALTPPPPPASPGAPAPARP